MELRPVGTFIEDAPADSQSYVRNNNAWVVASAGVTDHTLLTNIGVTSHADIDTALGLFAAHALDATIHFTEASIDHTAITNIGVNTHAQIDTHIADGTIHFADAPADAQDYVRNNNAWAVASPGGVTDHTLLTNIGVNTHAQIDTHLADGTIHFTEASIDHANILNIGTNSHAQIDTHIADGTIHFTEASIAHANISGIGVNTHAQIDTHLADGTIHFTEASIDHTAISNIGTNSHAAIDSHIADATIHFTEASIDHTAISNIGTNTHAQIDTHIADVTGNPHGVTLQDAYDADDTANPHILLTSGNPMRWRAAVSGPVVQFQDTLGANILEVDDTFVEVDGQLRIVDAFTNHGSLISLTMADTFTTGGAYIGGGLASTGAVTYNNSFFIWALLAENKTYNAAAGPGFAAFTLFNALPVIQNAGNFDLVQALVLNNGVSHRRTTAGTSNVTQNIGLANSPNTRAMVAGAVMTKTLGDTAVRHSPTFATVAGSTVNIGTQIGLDLVQPNVALFQTQLGVENMTAYHGVNFPNMTFGGASAVYNVINSQLNAGTNKRFLNHTGTAISTHNSALRFEADLAGPVYGLSQDYQAGWAAGGFFFEQQNAPNPVGQFRKSFPSTSRMLFDWSVDMELNINSALGFSLGAQSGANGNQFGNFVAGAQSVTVGGEYSQFLLTQAGNVTADAALSLIAAWTINAPSITLGTGSVTDAVALNVGGNPGTASVNRVGVRIISNPSGGSGVNAALWVTAGRSQFDGITVLPRNTDANRGAAGEAGRIIFNTDDGQLNIDDGTNWTLPDGSVT